MLFHFFLRAASVPERCVSHLWPLYFKALILHTHSSACSFQHALFFSFSFYFPADRQPLLLWQDVLILEAPAVQQLQFSAFQSQTEIWRPKMRRDLFCSSLAVNTPRCLCSRLGKTSFANTTATENSPTVLIKDCNYCFFCFFVFVSMHFLSPSVKRELTLSVKLLDCIIVELKKSNQIKKA